MATHSKTHIDRWLAYLARMGYSDHTLRSYRRGLVAWAAFLMGRDRSLESARATDVMDFTAQIEGSPATIKLRLAAVRGMHQWLTAHEIVARDVTAATKGPRKKAVRATRHHTRAEIDQLREHARLDRHRRCGAAVILGLLYDCMLRVSEAAAVRMENLDRDSWQMTVLGKGGVPRTIVVPYEVRDDITWWITNVRGPSPTGWLLPGRHGSTNHLHASTLDNTIDRLAKAAGLVGRFNPHSLRHARAEHYRAAGVDVVWISRTMGHTTVDMSGHYMHPAIHRSPG